MKSPLRHPAALLIGMIVLLSGCSHVNNQVMKLLASGVGVHAIVGERVMAGDARLYTDRTGTLMLDAKDGSNVNCSGFMRYTTSTGGAIQLRCSDGMQTSLTFTALTETSGHARNATDSVSLAYGLEAGAARPWLTAPAGKRIVVKGDTLQLEPEKNSTQ